MQPDADIHPLCNLFETFFLVRIIMKRNEPVGDPNYFYASVATMQRERTKGGLQAQREIDGSKFHENPYHVMPSNRNANR